MNSTTEKFHQIRSYRERGFTLIEIMVVIVILGILAVLIVPKVFNRPEQAKITVAKADLKSIAQSIELYKIDHGEYPADLQALVSNAEGGNSYLSEIPRNPWGQVYHYTANGQHNKGGYDLYTNAGNDGSGQLIANWSTAKQEG